MVPFDFLIFIFPTVCDSARTTHFSDGLWCRVSVSDLVCRCYRKRKIVLTFEDADWFVLKGAGIKLWLPEEKKYLILHSC